MQKYNTTTNIWCQINLGYNNKSMCSASDKSSINRLFMTDALDLSNNSCWNTATYYLYCMTLG